MKCPSCQFDQPENDYCMTCGVDVANWAPPELAEQRRKEQQRKAALSVDTTDLNKLKLIREEKLSLYAGLARISKSRRVKLTLLEALIKLSGDAPARLKRVISALAQRVDSGTTLSSAMASLPKIFDSVEIQIVRSYERLECPLRAFPIMADRTWRQAKFSEWLKRSLFYPGIVMLLAAFLIPIKQLRLGLGSYLAGVGIALAVLALLVAICMTLLPWLFRHPKLVATMRRMAWYLPYPANLYCMWVRSVFCKALADNIDAGITQSRALHGAALVTMDPHIMAAANTVIGDAGAKTEMASKLWNEGLIEHKDAMFLISGEYSSELTDSLRELAHEYETTSIQKGHTLMFFVSSAISVFMLVFFGLAAMDSIKEMSQGVKDVFVDPNQVY